MVKLKKYACYTYEMERPLLIEGKSKKEATTTVRHLGYTVESCRLMQTKKKKK